MRNHNTNRFSIKLAGESGQGINSMGEILTKSIKNLGYQPFATREYPSLIKGGVAAYQIDFSTNRVSSSSRYCDILTAVSRATVYEYLYGLKPGGLLLHTLAELTFDTNQKNFITQNNIEVYYLNASQEALMAGGNKIMANVVVLGAVWGYLGLPLDSLEQSVLQQFNKKPELLESNQKALAAGFRSQISSKESPALPQPQADGLTQSTPFTITGNDSLALGAIKAGVRAFYGYPMTPSTGIMSYIAHTAAQTGILVRQAEDEITAAQMSIGSMFMGTRALTATSGGGFDLMTESLSLSGMTETPWVCILGQRPGPATGLPTWSAAGDLNLALYGGHGEFPRVVVAASDAESAYRLVQEAFNIAEVYQLPVIVLTDKQIAESLYTVEDFGPEVKIDRGLHEITDSEPRSTDRYAFTPSGVSSRWLPGQFDATYNGNSDEHTMDGSTTEDPEIAIAMMDKRMRKIDTLSPKLQKPKIYGPKSAKYTFVGWGSTLSPMIDMLDLWAQQKTKHDINYLHYEYLNPIDTTYIRKAYESGGKLILIENNKTAQLGSLLKSKVAIDFHDTLLKYDGRAFHIEDILDYIEDKKL